MPKIYIYEAEPGDWRFDDDPGVEKIFGAFTEVSEDTLDLYRNLRKSRQILNYMLEEDKKKQQEFDWSTYFPEGNKTNE